MRLQNYLIGGACNAKRSPPPPPMGTETSRTCGGICRHLARQWLNRGELSLGTGTTNQKGHESSEKVEQRKEPTQGKSARPPAFLPVLNRKPQNEGFAAESNAKM
jgi:hypothetical protein